MSSCKRKEGQSEEGRSRREAVKEDETHLASIVADAAPEHTSEDLQGMKVFEEVEQLTRDRMLHLGTRASLRGKENRISSASLTRVSDTDSSDGLDPVGDDRTPKSVKGCLSGRQLYGSSRGEAKEGEGRTFGRGYHCFGVELDRNDVRVGI